MTSISGVGGVPLNITVPEADKKSFTAMSAARRNSIAFKEFILSEAFEEMGYEGQSTFKRASNLSMLLEKLDDVKGHFTGGAPLVTEASQKDGGPKVAILNIFHPDYDASNLTDENRDILRAASYFEGIDFNNLQASDFDKFDEVTKRLEKSLNDFQNNSIPSDAEAKINEIFSSLKGQGIVV